MTKNDIYSVFKEDISSSYFSAYSLIQDLNENKEKLGVNYTKELMVDIVFENIQRDNLRIPDKNISRENFDNSKIMKNEINYLKKDPKTQKNIESIENFTDGFELKKEIIPQNNYNPELVFQQKNELTAFLKKSSPEKELTLNITKNK